MGRHRLLLWAGVVAVLLVGGVAGAIIATSANSPSNATTSGNGSACDITAVASRELPSVVTIMAGSGTASGVGSGEFIRSNGYILTNNHVIAPAVAGGTLEVLLGNGDTARAQIVGRDPLTDLAVIRVNSGSGFRVISLGDSSKLRIGEPVIALGAPLGLSSTVTSGIVSALDRTVHVPGESESQPALLIDAVQTDAAINPGNSGGALVDCRGNLIGIPTAGASVPSPSGQAGGGSIGLGFAIPVNLAKKVSDEIIDTGRVAHAFIGLQAEPLSPNAAATGGPTAGLRVTAVVPSGPAASAGLQVGDIITSIDGTPAASTDQLMTLTLAKRAGDRVEFAYERGGKRSTTTVTLSNGA